MIGRGRVHTCPLLCFQGVLKMADELLEEEVVIPPEEGGEEVVIPPEEEENPLLEAVKVRLAIVGKEHDRLLLGYIDDTKEFLLSAGVPVSILDSKKAYGIIARGVSDQWLGGEKFSEMFKQRAIQLACEEVEDEVQTESV